MEWSRGNVACISHNCVPKSVKQALGYVNLMVFVINRLQQRIMQRLLDKSGADSTQTR
jgi:hypothetical protein